MATIAKDIIFARMALDGGPPPLLYVPEAASVAVAKGGLVQFNAAGYVTEITGDTPSRIYGVAAEAGHNSTPAGTNDLAVFLVKDDVIFEANMLQTALADRVSVAGDIGTVMAIQRDSVAPNRWYLNASTKAGANIRVFVHRLSTNYTQVIGDTNVRVWFTFLPNWVEFAGTS